MDGTSYPLWVDRFDELLKAGQVDFPNISKDEINDKSKGDVLAKGVAVLQTTWFIVQCIARGVKKLDVTTLEIFTVGFAALNAVMYFLWWDKPHNVEQAYMIPLKVLPAIPDPEGDKLLQAPSSNSGNPVASSTTAVAPIPALESYLEQSPRTVTPVSTPTSHPSTPPPEPLSTPHVSIRHAVGRNIYAFLSAIIRLIVNPYFWMATDHDMSDDKNYVGVFYAYNAGRSAFKFGIMLPITITYGAIHCAAWSFSFPTSAERVLWHVSSLVLVAVPFYFFVVLLFIGSFDEKPWVFQVAKLTGAFGLLMYVFARLILMVLAFVGLRRLDSIFPSSRVKPITGCFNAIK